MEKFRLHILGCGSALPTSVHNPSAQVLNIREKLYMIDCGEGTQLQFRKSKLKFSRLTSVFISHMHGDHCFGLVGIISTMALLGRTADINVFLPKDGEEIVRAQLDYFCRDIPFNVNLVTFDGGEERMIFEDNSITVTTVPLKHRIACCGFLFREKQGLRHINREMCDFYGIPAFMIGKIKNGEDFVTEDGETVANERITFPPDPVRSYAYCSDTIYMPELEKQLKGIDLLYHEATFCNEDVKRAKETYHTTSGEAAALALKAEVKKLLIGHFSARYTDSNQLLRECRSIFRNTVAATEGLTVDI